MPNAGMSVALLSNPEFDDLTRMRMLPEGEAAERGSQLLYPAQIVALSALCDRMDSALTTKIL
ncbi:hypothetical protein [Paraburkholderia sp. BL25I1N1]|uniref:hypothetical protein n=1 Tax=Paraburkholderia sp. BL25I1N1 TaxID=1938804 RepID=UPI0011B24217|nr:hypothetical protein [Paraburkholderia sp. BL25I1N1]